LREQLKRLEELQLFDARIHEKNADLQSIPVKLQASHNELERMENLLATDRAQLAETQRYHAAQKSHLADDEVMVSTARHKLSLAKNSREYMAAQREIDQARDSFAAREVEASKLVDAIQAKETVLAERAAALQTLRESVQNDEERDREHMKGLESEIAKIRFERDQIAVNVRADVLKRYSAIRMRRGLAVVTVRSGTCQGCNMNIPPQLYNTLQRGTSLETCPSCHRIIYWDEIMKGPAAEGAAPVAPAGTAPAAKIATAGS